MVLKADEVAKEVNLWAKNETNGFIKEILPPRSVHNLTRLVFANAMHFKAAWDDPFDIPMTKDYDFHLLNGSSVKVPFMTNMKDQFISVFDDFKVLRLPYRQGEDKRYFSMYIFLPNAKDGLTDLVENMASKFELLQHNLPLIQKKVRNFKIPRFKFSIWLETSDMLKELGVILPFSPRSLTKMVDSLVGPNLFVSNIFEKYFIEINEKGTKVASASAAVVTLCMRMGDPLDFVADHPFLFLIREDSTETIIFVGQVLNPLVR